MALSVVLNLGGANSGYFTLDGSVDLLRRQ
jgi:hypothetical protein